MEICPNCKKENLRHLHDTAQGLKGTHIANSERYICECGLYIDTAKEAAEHGLKFRFD